jgi:TM2 domain-containing membrane protein YozV
MGEMITKPDANPILLAVLNLFLFGAVGYFMMGQSGKGIAALIYWFVGSLCTAIAIPVPLIVAALTAYDAYLLGQKLQAGESIGEKENGLAFLSNLPGFK